MAKRDVKAELENILVREKAPKEKKKPALELSLHPAQMEVFRSPARIKVLCTSRRFGKSRLLLTTVLERALSFKGEYDPASPPVVVLLMPSLKQAKAIHWNPITNLLAGHPAVKKVYKNETRIELIDGLPDILLRGGNEDSGDNLRGLKLYHVSIDEFQDLKPVVWSEVVRPALTDTPGSTAFLCGTPKGAGTYFHRLWNTDLPDWASFHYNIYDNPFIDPKEIELTKNSLPDRIFAQEFLAHWETFSGQVYSSLSSENIISDEEAFALDFKEFYLGIDFGDVNPAIVVVGRRKSHSPRPYYYVVDSWVNPHKGSVVEAHVFLDKAKELANKWKVVKSYADPSQPARILSWRKENIPKLLKGFNPISEGNGIVDTLLYQKRLKIVESQREFFNEMQAYHRDSIDGVVLESIARNQEDHRCDALRYVLATIERTNMSTLLNGREAIPEPSKEGHEEFNEESLYGNL